MKLIRTTPTHEIWLGNFQGTDVRFMKNLLTNEICVDAHQYAQCIGYASLTEMMHDDSVLDACNELKNETGKFPIFKQEF